MGPDKNKMLIKREGKETIRSFYSTTISWEKKRWRGW
jgi:hypothetical protein